MNLLPQGFDLCQFCAYVFSEQVEGADDPIRGAGSGTWFAGNRAGKPAGFALRFAMTRDLNRRRFGATHSFRQAFNLARFYLTMHCEGLATLQGGRPLP